VPLAVARHDGGDRRQAHVGMEAVRTRLVLAEYYSTTAHVWAAVDTRNILCKEVAHRAPARRDSIGSEALRAPRSLAMYDT
jgi:hypothetical protein